MKTHLRSDPDIRSAEIDAETELLILASDGLWKVPYLTLLVYSYFLKFTCQQTSVPLLQVMSNQESVDIAKKIKDPQKAAKQLAAEALNRESKDDISCIVVRF